MPRPFFHDIFSADELYPILGPLSQEGGMAKLAWPSAGKERVQ